MSTIEIEGIHYTLDDLTRYDGIIQNNPLAEQLVKLINSIVSESDRIDSERLELELECERLEGALDRYDQIADEIQFIANQVNESLDDIPYKEIEERWGAISHAAQECLRELNND